MKRVLMAGLGVLIGTSPALGGEATPLDLDAQTIQTSPVLQRWLKEVPNVADDIQNDPSFRTRSRLGSVRFSSAQSGLNLGIEDVRIGKTRLTASGNYATTFDGSQRSLGADLHYYVRPLGNYINVAPIVGYRHLATHQYSTSGINLGVRVLLVLSRGGGADVALSQSWVAPGSDAEVGLSTLSFGYAVTHHFRISTDLQRQNSRQGHDDRIGVGLEWMP